MTDILKQVWVGTRITHGTDAFAHLVRSFSSASEIYDADEERLTSALGRHRRDIRALLDKSTADAERLLGFCASLDIAVFPFWDPRYPASLRRIPDPPVWLFVKGKLPDFETSVSIAVVGTRKSSEYGRKMTFEIAEDLATAGAVVVSGMALGIDGIAAAAAIEAKGTTVAVLGNGLDIVYPAEHVLLMRAILRCGAIVSEYPPGTPPDKWNFPKRNRIISGLSDAVIVTEGSLHSGSMYTAEYARKQEKPLYALPGPVDEPGGEGPMRLLREGAKALSCADDLLSDFDELFPGRLNVFRLLEKKESDAERVLETYRVRCQSDKHRRLSPKEEEPTAKPEAAPVAKHVYDGCDLSGTELDVFNRIPETGDCIPDDLTGAGIGIREVGAALTMLEIRGVVRVAPGGRISRNQ